MEVDQDQQKEEREQAIKVLQTFSQPIASNLHSFFSNHFQELKNVLLFKNKKKPQKRDE